jgi:hypothetical protein
MSSTLTEELRPYFLLGGLTGKDLWPAIDVVFISYFILVVFPRWKWTPPATLVIPTFHSILYVGSLFSTMLNPRENAPDIDFTTMEGVASLLREPDVVFPAWIHYIVFDFLVSRMIVMDSVQRGTPMLYHILVIVPCVFATLMVGPTGFLSYMILRNVIPGSSDVKQKIKIL